MDLLTRGQLAKHSGVNAETIRYYEQRGLLTPAQRSQSGYRLFPLTAIRRVHFIKRAQALGFSLQEINILLELKVSPDANCHEVRSKVETKIADINEKIQLLNAIKQQLIHLATVCPGGGSLSECPIIEILDAEDARDAI